MEKIEIEKEKEKQKKVVTYRIRRLINGQKK